VADISCASSPWSELPRAGSEADVSIFELRDGKFEFEDSDGGKRTGRQMLVNKAVVRRGQVFVNAI
jgi:predicted amidohydrolase